MSPLDDGTILDKILLKIDLFDNVANNDVRGVCWTNLTPMNIQ